MNSIWKPVKNFTPGRGMKPEFITIHIAESSSLSGTQSWFNNLNSGASAHSIVSDQEIWDFVHSTDTAWHTGTNSIVGATFKGFKFASNGKLINPNLYTIGIEHLGFHGKEISEATYALSAGKIKYLAERYNMAIDEAHLPSHKSIYPYHNCPDIAVNIPKLAALARNAVAIPPG